MNTDDLISVQEAARIIGRDQSRVRRYLAAGQLAGRNFGRVWLVSRKAAEAFRRPEMGRPPRAPQTKCLTSVRKRTSRKNRT